MPTIKESLSYQPAELAFGTSGLRGLVTDMTDLECYINARGFLQYLALQGQMAGSNVCIAGDLRQSTPRILGAMVQAVEDAGFEPVYCGLLPTPAVAFYALQQQSPCIMVTGSHIPDDRNGIKFYKADGEVLKADEADIKAAVAAVRQKEYAKPQEDSLFDEQGMLRQPVELPVQQPAAQETYQRRYVDVFDNQTFAGKKIVFYQHSAVGRDLLMNLLQQLGAEVVPVGRSEKFIPIDTENVTPADQAYFKQLAQEHPDAFAIVSTDGDSDRPFVIDERGIFHRGDELGALVADWLKADFAAIPISSNDAVDKHLTDKGVAWKHTKIGSPHVIVAMQEAVAAGKQRVVGWEVNGGFLLGCDLEVNGKTLAALPTRDAFLPIVIALRLAVDQNQAVSEVFGILPQRFTDAGLIDNFPVEVSKKIVDRFGTDDETTRAALADFFSADRGFGKVTGINALDGVRIFFDNGDVAHLRPSGNAPQLRIYSVADSQERAAQIVSMAIAEPDGIFRTIEKAV